MMCNNQAIFTNTDYVITWHFVLAWGMLYNDLAHCFVLLCLCNSYPWPIFNTNISLERYNFSDIIPSIYVLLYIKLNQINKCCASTRVGLLPGCHKPTTNQTNNCKQNHWSVLERINLCSVPQGKIWLLKNIA